MKLSKAKQQRLAEIKPRLYELTYKKRELQDKGKKLSPEEDDEFASLNHENDLLVCGKGGAFAKEVYTQGFSDRLSDLLKETEDLIERVKADNKQNGIGA